jgi:hypothetical protein
VDLVVPPRTPERAPDPEAQPEAANWRRIALAMATNAAKAAGRRPTFAGLDTENPAEFLEEYKRYSTDAQVSSSGEEVVGGNLMFPPNSGSMGEIPPG